MKTRKITRQSDQKLVVANCQIANHFLERLKGLMFQSTLPLGSGLWLEPCNSIHTFFMRFPIDVVYLSKDTNLYRIVRIHSSMKPWRFDLPVFAANAVLELPVGQAHELLSGDILCLS